LGPYIGLALIVGICSASWPIRRDAGLREIALDSKLAWQLDGGFTGESFTYRFYPGRQDQAADPLELRIT
jgi:hypothetical protein